jgi:hypothetical protein
MDNIIPEVGCSEQPTKIDRIVSDAQAAWARLNNFHTWADWVLVATALAAGRNETMHMAGTNKPSGPKFKREINRWLKEKNLDAIDKTTRSRSIECFEHLADIEKWRATLSVSERLALNHPTTVLRHWKRKTVVPDPNAVKKVSIREKLNATIAELEEQNFRMRKEIERGGGDLWTRDDTAKDIALVISSQFSHSKISDIARELAKLAREKSSEAKARQAAQVGRNGTPPSDSDVR